MVTWTDCVRPFNQSIAGLLEKTFVKSIHYVQSVRFTGAFMYARANAGWFKRSVAHIESLDTRMRP